MYLSCERGMWSGNLTRPLQGPGLLSHGRRRDGYLSSCPPLWDTVCPVLLLATPRLMGAPPALVGLSGCGSGEHRGSCSVVDSGRWRAVMVGTHAVFAEMLWVGCYVRGIVNGWSIALMEVKAHRGPGLTGRGGGRRVMKHVTVAHPPRSSSHPSRATRLRQSKLLSAFTTADPFHLQLDLGCKGLIDWQCKAVQSLTSRPRGPHPRRIRQAYSVQSSSWSYGVQLLVHRLNIAAYHELYARADSAS